MTSTIPDPETAEPKYWSDEEGKIIEGAQLSEVPTSLDSILGSYCWVFSWDPEFNEEFTKFMGSLKITLKDPALTASMDNISGSFRCGDIKASFNGLETAKVKEWVRGEDGDSPVEIEKEWTKTFWDITRLENGDARDVELLEEGNGFGLCTAKDDSGYPFLRFYWVCEDDDIVDPRGSWLGKRLVDKKFWRLTDTERQRLGIGLTEKEVEELAKKGSTSDNDALGGGDGEEGHKAMEIPVGEGDVAAEVEIKAGVKRKHETEDPEANSAKRKP